MHISAMCTKVIKFGNRFYILKIYMCTKYSSFANHGRDEA